MELLIVLAVLVAISAMAAPSLIERMKDSTVQESAESVREIVAEARTYAIDSGIDYQFRYEPNGQYFVVLPTEQEPTTANSTSTDSSSGEYMRLSGELPEGLSLRAMDGEEDSSERLEPEWFGALPDAGVLSEKSWSQPVYFHFDGSALDHTFRVMDTDGRTAEISIRGLTGSVRLSGVYREEQK